MIKDTSYCEQCAEPTTHLNVQIGVILNNKYEAYEDKLASQCKDKYQVNAQLSAKYDSYFNFYFLKPADEIVFNHHLALNTIRFKDAAIFADSHEYLKRSYYLINSAGKEEISDRIALLAGTLCTILEFYASSIALKYEYPLMLLTNTKEIFLKRLKRMKKIIAEEGSSDQSASSPKTKKHVSVDSSGFLDTVSSDELERKSNDHRVNLSDFSVASSQNLVYNIFSELPVEEKESERDEIFIGEETEELLSVFHEHLHSDHKKKKGKVSNQIKPLKIDESIQEERYEVETQGQELFPNVKEQVDRVKVSADGHLNESKEGRTKRESSERKSDKQSKKQNGNKNLFVEQLAHRQGQNIISEYRIDLKNGPDPKNLIVDFDEFDREEVISKYERMMAKEAAAKREMLLSKNHLLNGERDNQHLEIKKEVRKASGITITPLQSLKAREQAREKARGEMRDYTCGEANKYSNNISPKQPMNHSGQQGNCRYTINNRKIVAVNQLVSGNFPRNTQFSKQGEEDNRVGYNYRNTAINDQDRRRLHELDAGKEQTDRAKWLQWKQKQVSAEPKDRKDPFLKKPRQEIKYFEHCEPYLHDQEQIEYPYKAEMVCSVSPNPRLKSMRLSTNQLAVDTQYVKAVPQQAIMSDRAAKKRLIRERAEALLNRVKSRGEVRIDRYDLAHY